MKYNIIADVAGRYTELMNLIKIMPQNNKIILVGDIIDRGVDSKKVVDYCMDNPVIVLKGNHEAMMIEAYNGNIYDHIHNGGKATLYSYGIDHPEDYPSSHIEWMKDLPIFFKDEGLFISHAPWMANLELGEYASEHWAVWNRDAPSYREGIYQIFGHNHVAEIYYKDVIDYAQCIDNCRNKVLRGLTWPDKIIYEVPYD